jgi:hypothetical protein
MWFSNWMPEPVWLLNGAVGPVYISLANTELPPAEGWQDVGGGGAMPVMRLTAYNRLAPVGLYKDTACTIPATEAGDLIAAWRDEISGSGLVAVQAVSNKRPILRFVSGMPTLDFDGVDDFLIATEVPTIAGIISAAVTGMYDSTAQSNGRLLSMADASNMDWEGSTGVVLAFRPLSGSEIGVQYADYLGHQEILPGEWFTFASRATGSAIETWKNGDNKVTSSVDTTAISATRIKIGGSFAFSDVADLWGGYVNNVAVGPWTEDQTLQVQDHFKGLSPDPLMGTAFSLRLQTHRGDGIPLGLYQDTACTIPATTDGDFIAAWRDELSGSGLFAVQSISTKQPKLRFSGGVPWLEFDGIDDWMSIGEWSGQTTYTSLIKSNSSEFNSYWSIVDANDGESGRWGFIGEAGQSHLHGNPYPAAVRKDGTAITSPFDVSPINEWSIFSVKTQSKSPGEIGILQLDGSQFANARISALAIHSGNPPIDSDQVARTENYFRSLAPTDPL